MKHAVGAVLSILILGCNSADREPDYTQAVVHVDNNLSGGYCSGALIAPNLVLTARHCVASLAEKGNDCANNRFSANVEPQHLRIVFTSPGSHELRLQNPLASHFARARFVLTPQDDGDSSCGRDIAAIVLDHGIPSAVATPLAIRLDPDAQTADAVEMIGFGAMEDDILRARTSTAGSIACVRARCEAKVSNAEFMSGYRGCTGDSGGPVLDREQKLLGIHTSGFQPAGNRCGDSTVAVSVPYYAAFIQESLEIASSL